MAKLSEHPAANFAKLLYLGDSGTGKTGSLVSLVQAGYKLRILDLDNGLDALRQHLAQIDPKLLDEVDYITVSDLIKSSQAGPITTARAYSKGLSFLDKWDDGSKPAEWGKDTIFVLDSLTMFGKAAYEWAKSMTPNAREQRTWYFAAQQGVEKAISLLCADTFKTNVIVITHVNYKEVTEGVHKGYPSAIGAALGPTLPSYFNTMIQCEVKGSGKNVARTIQTLPSPIIDLKNPAPFKLEKSYPIASGLADIFKALKALK